MKVEWQEWILLAMAQISAKPKLVAEDESTFLVRWSDDNLDWVVDVSGYDKRTFWEVLKGNEPNNLISGFRNAIINAQNVKAFEVYSITVNGVTAKEFAKLFKDDPANAKLLIKDRGRPLYQKESL